MKNNGDTLSKLFHKLRMNICYDVGVCGCGKNCIKIRCMINMLKMAIIIRRTKNGK